MSDSAKLMTKDAIDGKLASLRVIAQANDSYRDISDDEKIVARHSGWDPIDYFNELVVEKREQPNGIFSFLLTTGGTRVTLEQRSHKDWSLVGTCLGLEKPMQRKIRDSSVLKFLDTFLSPTANMLDF